MFIRVQLFRAVVVVALWLMLPAGAAFAHGGHEHNGGADGGSLWMGAVGVLVLAALVYSMVRRHDPESGGDAGDDGQLASTDRDQ